MAFSFLGLMIFPAFGQAQGLTINNNTTISDIDPPKEVDNVIYNNSSKLTITGTLIVNGDFNMDKNDASLELKEGAILIVYGNFIAANKVNITLGPNSYFFIYGNFSKGGSSGQDVVIIDNAKIYILGNGDNWGDNLKSCDGTYQGTTSDANDACDFGTEEDYENNQDDFPDALVDQLNCYDLTAIANQTVCLGGSTTFSVSEIEGVNYQWQTKTQDTDWSPVGANSNIYTINNTSLNDNGNLYRVIVKSNDPANSNCKISISRKVSLSIQQAGIWTGTTDTNWNNTSNWSCDSLPTLETNVLIPENLTSNNFPVINAGTNALTKNINIETGASVIVNDNWLRIAGDITNSGVLNTESGSVSFEGVNAQTIPTSTFEKNRIQNLRINNASGVTSETIIEVTGVLKVETGNLYTGNRLSLISNEVQTALIDGSGEGEVIGQVSMQRYLDKAFGYKYFSSPFQNSVVNDFDPFMDFADATTGFPHFYSYNENRSININDTLRDATGWVVHAGNLNIAEGYALNFGNSTAAQTIELIGEVNNGVIPARPLENNHREYTRGFHLVGNPYPSPIDWNATQGWSRTKIDDGIYFFTASENNQYTGTYTAYVNDISTGDPLVDGRSSNIIPSMQGFFIKVSDSDAEDLVTGTFGMDNNVRINDFNQEFFRASEGDLKSLIRLNAGFNTETKNDALVIYFSPYATQNFEKEMDAHKLMNTDPAVPSFYNITENQKILAINAIPYPESRSYKKIPLGIKTNKNGEMKIHLASVENLNSNFNIYLIDHEKGKGQNLRNNPEYTFSIKKGTHNSRFELMFSEEEITSPAIAFNEPFDVAVENESVVVSLNLEEFEIGTLRASTVTGQIIQTKEARGKDRVIFDGITSNGVYVISLQVGEAQYVKKILIKK